MSSHGRMVRLWNIYGPEKLGPRSHVLTDWINACLTRREIVSMTDGLEARQFLHVDDTANALGQSTSHHVICHFAWCPALAIHNMLITTWWNVCGYNHTMYACGGDFHDLGLMMQHWDIVEPITDLSSGKCGFWCVIFSPNVTCHTTCPCVIHVSGPCDIHLSVSLSMSVSVSMSIMSVCEVNGWRCALLHTPSPRPSPRPSLRQDDMAQRPPIMSHVKQVSHMLRQWHGPDWHLI